MTNEQAIDILNAVKFILENYTEEMEEAFGMAINALTAQPEKMQLSEEEATSDCISRQTAIDALKEAFNPSITNFVKAKIAIDKLPSAQPEKRTQECTETHSCDLISRKMVLALPRNKVRSLRTYEVVEETINVTDIEHLPPAQPEIVRCKECVNADENYHCDYMTTWNYGDCFCSYGKRRTDVKADKGASR